ncbi:hypothetical protein DPMN_108164 [Dreissena polymorpha]|uniref:Uncharacterized protein n=1 Tax=Dreissena polymorpha TaxID=45954 RepID=A0A9D4K888_DREPO|nr:hypothetical protein DPMN_108164 [Dreissena polymorpha]
MLECLQTKCGRIEGRRTKTDPKTSPDCSAIFQLVRDNNKTNVLNKFHDDYTNNVTSRVLTRKRAQHPLDAISCIQETNVLTKFHENWAKNVISRKTALPTGGHVFSPIWTILELVQNINKTNVLTKFHDDCANMKTAPSPWQPYWTNNVTLRVFTCFQYINIEKTAPPPGGDVFLLIWTIFELVRDINKTNILIKFHDGWAKIVTFRAFIRKTAAPICGHVFKWTGTTFELNQQIIKTNILTNFKLDLGIIETNLLTKCHEHRTRYVASRAFTRKTVTPTGGHVLQPTGTTFKLNQHIIKTNILTNFKLDLGIIGTNLLTKFYEDLTRNMASKVFTRKSAPPTGGHTNILTNFKLDRSIIGTNILTTFHEDRTRNVASRVFTNKCGRTTDERTDRRMMDKDRSQKLT